MSLLPNSKTENIVIHSEEESRLLKELTERTDAEGKRMSRFLAMPDLSRTSDSPLAELVKRTLEIPELVGFDDPQVPEIVPVDISFDLFNFPPDHPARSKSDTYYVDGKNILRPHTTVVWYYYLKHPQIQERIAKGESLGLICHGKVYRKDEIDRHHMNVFHQMDGLYLIPNSQGTLISTDLEEILAKIAKAFFGADIEYRFNSDTFPYTHSSLEMEVKIGDRWIELLGGGMAQPEVLEKLGLTGYNGWAFGFGLERMAIVSMDLPDIRLLWSDDPRVKKQLKLGQKFVEVSKYPPITRDISFVVKSDFVPNNYFDLIRDLGGDLVEEVQLLDKYENEAKFGKDKISYTYRIVYRAADRTLVSSEVDAIQDKIYSQTATQFNAELR